LHPERADAGLCPEPPPAARTGARGRRRPGGAVVRRLRYALSPVSGRVAVSVLLLLRDAETWVVATIRAAVEALGDASGRVEIVAIDQCSGDNTLSALSVLYGQFRDLRILQDVTPGTALAHGLDAARGEVVLVCDAPVSGSELAWTWDRMKAGTRVAIVPGRVLGFRRTDGHAWLAGRDGGLVAAESRLRLRVGGRPPELRIAEYEAGIVDRVERLVRGGLGRLGLARLDRPLRRRASTSPAPSR